MLASIYVCVWVSLPLSLSFPSYPQQQAASFLSRLLPTCLTPSHSHSQIQFKSAPNEPVLPSLFLHPAVSLCTCQPLLSRLCLCSSLALGVVRLDAEEEENLSGGVQLGGAQRKRRKERLWHGLQDFPSERLKPRRLCKLYQEGDGSKRTNCATTHVQNTNRRRYV